MKSLYRDGAAGNAKLRGKRWKLLSCRCCVVRDFRLGERIKQSKKEVEDFRKEKI